MPRSRALIPSEHLDQAKRNEEFARGLLALKIPSLDWAITACFYSALHYVYFKIAPSTIFATHQDLENEIQAKYSNPSRVWPLYKKLKDASRNSRYYPQIAAHWKNDKTLVGSLITVLEDLKTELGI